MADMTFKVNLLPNSDLGYSLGSSDKRWKLNGVFTGNTIEYIEGTQTASTGTWTGNTKDSALYIGKTIAYKLPYAGSGNATLRLTLKGPDGTGTTTVDGAVYAGNTRLTTHYPANSVMIMVWNGTNWRTNPYYDTNTNTLVRTYAITTNEDFPLLSGSTAAGSGVPTHTSSYANLYGVLPGTLANRATINPSTGKITVPGGIAANLTGNVTGDVSGNAGTVNGHTVNADVPSGAEFTDTTYTFEGTYNASTNKAATESTVTNAINALDVSNISGFGAGKTLATLTETNGKIAATFQDISIITSQISDFGSYKTTQTAVSSPSVPASGTTTATAFIDTISQDANGVITASKKNLPTASTSVAGITTVGASGGAAAYNHTHTTSLASDTGTSTVTLTSGGKFKLTAGGNSVIFTMPTSNNYSHPTGNGNNHIPANGSSGQFLKWSANGTATWATISTSDISGYSSGVTSVSWDSTNGFQQSVDGGTASTIVSPSSLISDLGLSTAMHFRGIATVAITDGSTTDPTIPNYSFGTNGANAQAGDVIIDSSSSYEYVWTGSAWERLGGDSSYALSDHTHGKITNDGKIASSDNVTIGNNDRLIISDSSDSYLLKNSSIVFGTSETQALTNKGTWKSFSYVTLNGSANTAPSFYAPTAVGSNGNFLKSSGSGAPSWVSITEADISDFGSYKTTQTAVSDDTTTPTTSTTTFVSAVTQDTNGVITVTKKNLPVATDQVKGIMQAGTGLSVFSGTVSVSYGTTANTAAAGNHVHGNLTNNGKIGSTADYAVYTTTGGAITAGSLAFTDPTASSTTSTTFIDTVSQNSKGQITATKKTLPVASTSAAGIIQIGTSATNAAAGDHTHSEYVTDIDWTYDSSQGALASANGITQSKNGGTAQVVISQEELQQAIFIISATEPTDTNVIWLKPVS